MKKTVKFKVHSYPDLGDHAYWEFDFSTMRVVLWSQGADEWSPRREHELRRQDDTWQYMETEDQWRQRVAGYANHVAKLRGFLLGSPVNAAPDSVRDQFVSDLRGAEARLNALQERGPGWIDFSEPIARELEERWLDVKD